MAKNSQFQLQRDYTTIDMSSQSYPQMANFAINRCLKRYLCICLACLFRFLMRDISNGADDPFAILRFAIMIHER